MRGGVEVGRDGVEIEVRLEVEWHGTGQGGMGRVGGGAGGGVGWGDYWYRARWDPNNQ